MKVTVTVTGTTPEQFEKIVKTQFITIVNGIEKLGIDTRNYMRNTIKVSKHRKGGNDNLEKNIESIRISSGLGTGIIDHSVGVGYIPLLNEKAPYWRLINYGGMIGMNERWVRGFFGNGLPPDPSLRGTGVGTDYFYTVPKGANYNSYVMKVSSPIAPMNYIEKTKSWLQSVIRVHFSGWTRRTNLYKT